MRDAYRRLMRGLYIGCIVLSGLGMVAITLIIPAGVFMRYVMNDPLQWPEPASVIMMVAFSFIGGAAVFRANQQIAVEALMRAVNPPSRVAMQWGVHACTPHCITARLGGLTARISASTAICWLAR